MQAPTICLLWIGAVRLVHAGNVGVSVPAATICPVPCTAVCAGGAAAFARTSRVWLPLPNLRFSSAKLFSYSVKQNCTIVNHFLPACCCGICVAVLVRHNIRYGPYACVFARSLALWLDRAIARGTDLTILVALSCVSVMSRKPRAGSVTAFLLAAAVLAFSARRFVHLPPLYPRADSLLSFFAQLRAVPKDAWDWVGEVQKNGLKVMEDPWKFIYTEA